MAMNVVIVVVVVVVGGGWGCCWGCCCQICDYNRSASNFARTLVTILSTIAP